MQQLLRRVVQVVLGLNLYNLSYRVIKEYTRHKNVKKIAASIVDRKEPKHGDCVNSKDTNK